MYPQFVTDQMVCLCTTCSTYLIQKVSPPTYSLAAGYDFGQKDRMPELSVVERMVISRTLVLKVIVKLISPRGVNGENARQRALQGHIIAMPHDGIEVIARTLPRCDLNLQSQFLNVIFIGKREMFHLMRHRLMEDH